MTGVQLTLDLTDPDPPGPDYRRDRGARLALTSRPVHTITPAGGLL